MEIKIWPDKILNEVTLKVEVITDDVAVLVEDMFDTMYDRGGIGLAAPQVGRPLQVMVVDTTQVKNGTIKQEFVNPVIMEEHGSCINKEGCLSFPGVYVSVPRAERVVVEASDKDGNTFSVIADGIDAMCLQHEIDHLNGITFYDRLSPVKRKLHNKKFQKLKKWRKKHVIT